MLYESNIENYHMLLSVADRVIMMYDATKEIDENSINDLRDVLVYIKKDRVVEDQNHYFNEDHVSVSHLAYIADIPFQDAAEALQIMTNTQHNDF